MFRSVAGSDNEAPQIRHSVSAMFPPHLSPRSSVLFFFFFLFGQVEPVSLIRQRLSQGGGDLTWMGDTHADP